MGSRIFAAVAAGLVCGPAGAGPVEQSKMSAQPQMQVKQGAVEGCGIRIISIPPLSAASTFADAFDVSFNLYPGGLSLVKGGVIRLDEKSIKPGAPMPARPIKSFWIKAAGERATSPSATGVRQSDSPVGYLLYSAETKTVAALFSAVLERRPIWIGIQQKDADVDMIHAGTAELSEADEKQVHDCIDEYLVEMERAFGKRQPVSP